MIKNLINQINYPLPEQPLKLPIKNSRCLIIKSPANHFYGLLKASPIGSGLEFYLRPFQSLNIKTSGGPHGTMVSIRASNPAASGLILELPKKFLLILERYIVCVALPCVRL